MDGFEVVAQVHESSTELLPLAIAAVASMALVAGLAFAVQEHRPAASIAVAGPVALGAAALAAAGIAVVSLRRIRPGRVNVRGGAGRLVVNGRERAARQVFALPAQGGAVVEIEGAVSTLRLAVDSPLDAEALASAIAGRPTGLALVRLRLRATYLRFVSTIWAWLAVYGALALLPVAPVIAALLAAILLPVAAWITASALPGQVVVLPEGVLEIRLLRPRFHPASTIEAIRVVDDQHAALFLRGGERVELGELHDHPRDPHPGTEEPQAERLAARVARIIAA